MDKDKSGGIDVAELTNGLAFLGLEMTDEQILEALRMQAALVEMNEAKEKLSGAKGAS